MGKNKTNEEKKKYLQRYQDSVKQLEFCREELIRVEGLETKITPAMTGMPQGQPDGSKTELAVEHKQTAEQKYRDAIEKHQCILKEITAILDDQLEGKELLVLGELHEFTETVELQATGKDLLTVLTAIAKASLIGFRIRPDVENNALIFETYKGTDRTNPETVEQPVEFSQENKNMENAKIEEHDGDFYNFALVAGEGDGAARTVVQVDQTGGEYRREIWVDARDLQKGDLTAAQYAAILKQRGTEKLAACKMLRSFTADAIDRAGSAYKKDWDLGDTVAASREDWAAYRTDMVTEAEEVFEGVTDVPTVTPMLGSGLPETIDLES